MFVSAVDLSVEQLLPLVADGDAVWHTQSDQLPELPEHVQLPLLHVYQRIQAILITIVSALYTVIVVYTHEQLFHTHDIQYRYR